MVGALDFPRWISWPIFLSPDSYFGIEIKARSLPAVTDKNLDNINWYYDIDIAYEK